MILLLLTDSQSSSAFGVSRVAGPSSWNSLLSQWELIQHSWPVVFIGFLFVLGALPNVSGGWQILYSPCLFPVGILLKTWETRAGGDVNKAIPAAGHHLEVTSVFRSGLNLPLHPWEVTSVFKSGLNLLLPYWQRWNIPDQHFQEYLAFGTLGGSGALQAGPGVTWSIPAHRTCPCPWNGPGGTGDKGHGGDT